MEKVYDNYYFKDRPDGVELISGRPLPKDDDGVVRNKIFKDCRFHPNCEDVTFEDCSFVDCTGDKSLSKLF